MQLESSINFLNYKEINFKESIITPSLIDGNIFYLFRDNGVEIKIEVFKNNIYTDKDLYDFEIKYLKSALLKNSNNL